MTEKRLFFLHGGVKVGLYGMDRERFLNIAAQRGLHVADVSENNGEVTFWTTPVDFKRMKTIVKKTGVSLRIKERYGLPFGIYQNRKRKMMAFGVIAFFFIMYGMTLFIWDISFEGNYRFTDETLLHFMETLPVAYGMKKMDISCEELEAEIRNHFSEITWVSAEIRGTRLIVRVKENEAVLAPVEADSSPCDLTAGKSGTIVKTVVRSGLCQVKAGEQVEAGDLLVDGTIPIYDDSETLVNGHEVHADAEIYAETVHTVAKTVPLLKTVKSRTGNVRNGIFIKMFDKSFYIMMLADGGESWEYVMEQYQLKIFEDFYLPVYIGLLSAYEYVPYECNYTEEEVLSVCQIDLQEYMEKLSEKGIQILGSDGKIEKGESGWQFKGTLTVVEDIAKAVPVPEKQKEIQTVNERN